MVEKNPIFSDELISISPPDGIKDRVEFLARTLAYGALHGYWSARYIETSSGGFYTDGKGNFRENLRNYFDKVWENELPHPSLLQSFGFLQLDSTESHENGSAYFDNIETSIHRVYLLTPKSYALLDIPLERKIFISYRRNQSSAFALLLRDRLHVQGFDVFIDLQKINPGEIWRERLSQEISQADIFICLIAPETLNSENVRNEVRNAINKTDLLSIAIWHNGYVYDGKTYSEFGKLLDEQNALVVNPEDVLGYDNAITRLIQFLKPE